MVKTKVIITYGPSISSDLILKRVLKYADVIRVNFSHGDKSSWLDAVQKVRKASKELQKEIAMFADLPGPKVRVEKMSAPIQLKRGDMVRFSNSGAKHSIKVSYKSFHLDAKKGAVIEIGDGSARLQVKKIGGGVVTARALEDGAISSRKGVTLLGISMNLKSPTKTDMELARFAVKNGFDFVGQSFVRSAKDIKELKKACKVGIIAKIERRDAVRNIDEIARAADVVMVARGDLAEEVSLEHIPDVQRKIVKAAREAGKPVIVATQLLTSMINNPTPTRAEANDIASAIMEGADGLMLSDETIVGRYPEAAVNFLVRAARAAESSLSRQATVKPMVTTLKFGIAYAAAELADSYKTDCIFIPTKSGSTARIISRLRPNTDAIALVMDEHVRKELSMYYGIRAVRIRKYKSTDEMFGIVRKVAAGLGIKRYIIVSGSPNKPGSTDTLKYIGGA